MRDETLSIHAGYETDPITKSVAVPIYQTVAYEFDSADHGAALFNLETEGYRYSRIANPTTDVLERRVAALEGGVEALAVSSGQAALNYAVLNLLEPGANIVSVPQLYGTTHTLFAHVLPMQGFAVRFAESDQPAAMENLIDRNTKALFCESVGNPAGNICDIEALAQVAHRHGIPLVVDNTVATPILLRPIEYGADVVVPSLTIPVMPWRGNIWAGVPARCSPSGSAAASRPERSSMTRFASSSGWSTWGTPSRSPAIRLPPPIARCRRRSSARPACGPR